MNDQDREIICAGSILWDIIGRVEEELELGYDKGGKITRRPGGVAFNIAQKLSKLGLKPTMLSVIGEDPEGVQLSEHCQALGLDMQYVHCSKKYATDRYMAIEDRNGLVAAVADAQSLEHEGYKILEPLKDGRLGTPTNPSSSVMILDGNLTREQLSTMATSPILSKCELKLAPASPGKVARLGIFSKHPSTVLYCNLIEAEILADQSYADSIDASQGLLNIGFHRVVVTNGSKLACDAAQDIEPVTHKPKEVKILGVTGAGDVFMAVHIYAELSGRSRQEALNDAIMAAGNYVSGKEGA